jgi:hypothetical protein
MSPPPRPAAACSIIGAAFLALVCGGQVRAETTAANFRRLIPPDAVLLQRTAEGRPAPQIVLADLDGDGAKEAAACYNHPKAGFAEGWFEVLGEGVGKVRSLVRRRIPWSPTMKRLKKGKGLLRAADLTGDGRPELLLVTSGLNVFTMRGGRIEELLGPWGRTPDDVHDSRAILLNSVAECEARDLDGRAPAELVLEDNRIQDSFYGLDVLSWDGRCFREASSAFPDLFTEKLAELDKVAEKYFTWEKGAARAQILYHAGRKDAGVEFATDKLKNSGNLRYNLFLGAIAIQQGRLDEALRRLKTLGRTENIYRHLSVTYQRIGRSQVGKDAGTIADTFGAMRSALYERRPGPPEQAKPIIDKVMGGWDVKELYVQSLARPRLEEMIAAFEELSARDGGTGKQRLAARLKRLIANPEDELANALFAERLKSFATAKTPRELRSATGGRSPMFFWLLDTNCGVDALIEGARSTHPFVRIMATLALARTGSKKALPRLEALLHEPIVDLDQGLLAVFAEAHSAGTGDKVEAFAQGIRDAAVGGLGSFGTEEAASLLGGRLRVAGEDESRKLVQALGEVRPAAAIPLIERLLEAPGVKAVALDALSKMKRQKEIQVRIAAREPRARAGEAGDARAMLDHLAEQWSSRDRYKLSGKLRALAPEIVPAIMEYLKRRDPGEGDGVAWFLIGLLASVKDKRSTAVLKRAYELYPVARERLSRRRGAGGTHKALALALTELTGKEHKYLRIIPFE